MSRFQRNRISAGKSNDSRSSSSSSGITSRKIANTHKNEKEDVLENDFEMPDENELKELQERLQLLQQKKMRREIDRENAKKEIKECEMEAQKMGISNLEELQEYVIQLEQEDKKNMEEFLNFLEEEENILMEVERRLADLESNE